MPINDVYRCQWLARGEPCGEILTEDSANRIIYRNLELTVCRYHKKLQQNLVLLESSYEPNITLKTDRVVKEGT